MHNIGKILKDLMQSIFVAIAKDSNTKLRDQRFHQNFIEKRSRTNRARALFNSLTSLFIWNIQT